jgi:hypothetical protein
MTRATEMYVDGDLDRANYEALCDKARADLEASETELARLREARPEPALPTLDAVLGEAGDWAAALESADVPSQRDVLGALIDRVVPRRISRGKFEVEISWTPLGEGLRQLTGATASTSAA